MKFELRCFVLLALIELARAEFEPLTCLSCEAGFYLNQSSVVCVECPFGSTTFAYSNASNVSACVCIDGFEPRNFVCQHCSFGFFKTSVTNDSCTVCQDNANTNFTGAVSNDDCLCNAGFTPDAEDSTCMSCVAGTFKSWLGDEVCLLCPQDTFCVGGNVEPAVCVEHSSSSVGSVKLSDCVCEAGYYLDSDLAGTYRCLPCPAGTYNAISNQTVCVQCPENTYNPDLAQLACMYDCDVNANSAAGSTVVEDCKCNLGYAGDPGDTCVACAPGTFRQNSFAYLCEPCPPHTYNVDHAADNHAFCVPCQNNTESAAGSPQQSACVCKSGFSSKFVFDENSLKQYYECTECAAGKFQDTANSSYCDDCPAGKFSIAVAAVLANTCVDCSAGSYAVQTGTTECVLCAAGTWQNLALVQHQQQPCSVCPQNSSHNHLGSSNVHDCLCAAGFDKELFDDVFVCELCKAGSFCPGNGTMLPCPTNHFSDLGVTLECTQCAEFSKAVISGPLDSASRCVCIPGAEGTFHESCTPCEAGYFQAFDYTYVGSYAVEYAPRMECMPCLNGTYQESTAATTCTACPNASSSLMHSSDLTSCVCQPGFHGADGGPCEQCPVSFYCPGGSTLSPCMLHATSLHGSYDVHACECLPSYYAVSSGSLCQKCPANHFCSGGLAIEACAENSSSVSGSLQIENCVCHEGMWRGCIWTGNETLNENGPCTIDYTLPCFACAEDVICVNNTLQHCPAHSTSERQSSEPLHCVCENGYVADYGDHIEHAEVPLHDIDHHHH